MAKKLTQEEFIKKCKEIHNNFYSYDEVIYKNSNTDIKILCPKHGYFNQNSYLHSKGHGCLKCMKEKLRNERKMSNEEIISKFNKVHNNKYDYSLINYRGLNTNKIIIICPIHGPFEQYPKNHINGMGCPKCSKNNPYNKLSKNTLKDDMNKIHNNKYEYIIPDNVNAKSKIKIICPTHGEFIQKLGNHIHKKQGCPICSESIGEKIIASYLTQNNVIFIRQKTFDDCINIKKLKFDFYLPEFNTIIEFDGLQHVKPILKFGGDNYFNYIKLCDKIKTEYCIKNGIKLIRIPYTEFKNIEKIIKSEL